MRDPRCRGMLSAQDDLPQGSWRYAEREPQRVAVVCKSVAGSGRFRERTQRDGSTARTSWLRCSQHSESK